ncbi:spore germination protein [Neobacillus muris]|uniref:spore germination protein n=1 Tax=Neobacillus muris TaxID=2941334 RepID=UPI00203C7569|nr:spore germination protein [Neobacillus muris]
MPTMKVESIKKNILNKIGQPSSDLVAREVHTKEKYMEILYINTISDESIIHDKLLTPFFEIEDQQDFLTFLQSHPKILPFKDEQKAIEDLLKGVVIIFYQNFIFTFDSKANLAKVTSGTVVETTVQGPQSGFTESLHTNVGLVRERYPVPELTIESLSIGSISKTDVMLLYDSRFADPDTVKKMIDFLKTVHIQMFQSGEQLLDSITKHNRSFFPTMLVTERPDRSAVNLSTGKLIILVNGSPFAVIAPSVMKDFMSSMEDIYQTYWVGRFLQLLRFVGFNISVVLPGMYVALTAYNPEVFRVQLALSIAGSRTAVPYPAFVEVLLMLFMMELLTEASIRLPKAIGPTATTVGGLILGQAATEAGLVSNIMVIIVSFVAITNFVVPINTFSFTIRVLKYLIWALGTIFGLVGVVLGFLMINAYMVKLDSFGVPYLTLLQSKPKN